MMCEKCKFAIWEEGVVVDCKKDLPEPEWNEEEECFECEEYKYYDPVEESIDAQFEEGDRLYHEMRDEGLL